jgi:SAM-dependent methyltransferase
MAADLFPPVFWEIHDGNPREGPGCREATLRALQMTGGLPMRSRILDVGCGPGAQTHDLAGAGGSWIVAVDNHLPYLAAHSGEWGRAAADMTALPFRDGAFDLVWAEGSVYIAGFEEGLRRWRRLLRPGGAVAVTEISWLNPAPPPPLRDFWAAAYPAIRGIDGNLNAMERAGYRPAGHFVLPEEAWWSYYRPLEARLRALRTRHAGDPGALEVLDEEQREIDLYRRYSEFYGYVFYIGHRAD